MFSRLVKRPVMEYVKLRRLARASEALAEKRGRIIDVALEFGFGSHETFTRAFKSAYGTTPEQYRDRPVPLNQFIRPDLLLKYILVDENVPLITDSIVIEIKRETLPVLKSYVGVSRQLPVGQADAGQNTGIDMPGQVWGEFGEKKSGIPNLLPRGNELGVSYFGTEEGCFTYFAGAEAATNEPIEGYTQFQLQEGEYLVCGFEAENSEVLVKEAFDKALKYLFGTWLPRHGLETEPFCAEKYFKTAEGEAYMELWVRALPNV